MNQMIPEHQFAHKPAYSMGEKLADFLGIGPRADAARHLMQLPDHLLRDMGLDRDEIRSVTGLERGR